MIINESDLASYLFMTWSSKKRFRIPDFQRPYVWDEQIVEDFRKDLVDLENNISFLWSLIFLNNQNWKYDIVDWQQRIMTITIILSALRNYAKTIWEHWHTHLISSIQARIAQVDNLWNSWDYYLECWENTNKFFVENILDSNADMNHYDWPRVLKKETSKWNIKRNYKYIYEIIWEAINWQLDDNKAQYIDNILQNLDKYKIVYIEVDSDEEAYTAFEIVNARWQELWNIDLLKNLFFKLAAADGNKKPMVEKWSKIEDNISNASMTKVNLESYLKHFWHARYWKSRILSTRRLFKEFKNEIESEKWRYDSFSDEMLEDSLLYEWFTNPMAFEFLSHNKYNKQVQDYLYSLKNFWITQAYILFLMLFRYKDSIWEKNVRNIIRSVASFHFSYSAISKLQWNKVEKLYWRYAEEFIIAVESESQDNFNEIYWWFKSKLLSLFPKEWEFKDNFIELRYKSNNKDLLRYCLREYEKIIKWGYGESIPDFTNTNIEHIIAQKNNWFDEQMHHWIWNLMLLSEKLNSKCGNKELSEKLPFYKESEFEMVGDVVDTIASNNGSRNDEDINSRKKHIADSLYDYSKKIIQSQ